MLSSLLLWGVGLALAQEAEDPVDASAPAEEAPVVSPRIGSEPPPPPPPEPPPPPPTPVSAPPPPPPPAAPVYEDKIRPEYRGMRFEVGVRLGWAGAPDGLLDIWFTNTADPGWPLPTGRPSINAVTYGVEFWFEKRHQVGIVYFDVVQGVIPEGLWDDRDTNGVQYYEGDYWKPTAFFGAVVLGINGGYDAPIVHMADNEQQIGFSFVITGGAGVAVLVGRIDTWSYDYVSGTSSWELYQGGFASDGTEDFGSPVWPVPDLQLGFKLNVKDRFTMRFEGGLHGGLAAGLKLGGRI